MYKPKIVVVGSLNMDVVVKADRAPKLGETIMGNEVHFIPGGKGANQAVAAARLGAYVTMVGAVGQDDFGQSLLKSLEKNEIQKDTVKIVTHVSTGLASILLAEGDNQIVVVSGANEHCLPEDVCRYEEFIAQADVVMLQLEIPIQTVAAAAELAKQYGKKVILNPAPARDLPMELLRNVDYIIPNRSELTMLSKTDAEEQLEEAMKNLAGRGPEYVITTLGSEGAAFMKRGDKPIMTSSYKVKVVDTTGAGDAFNAGFAYALATGKDLASAVSFATRVSALAVTKLGAQSGMPTMEEVLAYPFQ